MKRTAFLLIIALMLTTVAFASSDKIEISFKVGDSVLKINGTDTAVQTPYVVGDGVTLVPLRVITEAFGADVSWEDSTQTVTLNYPGVNIVLQIGNPVADVNQKANRLLSAPELKDDTTMVPLRFISETFGAEVSYDEKTEEISVVKDLSGNGTATVVGSIDSAKIGDSYYGWSMDNPVDMQMSERDFDGTYTEFSDGDNQIAVNIFPKEEDYDFERDFVNKKNLIKGYTLVKADKNTDIADKKVMNFQVKNKEVFISIKCFETKQYVAEVMGYFSNSDADLKNEGIRIIDTFDCSFPDADIYDLSNVVDGMRTFSGGELNLSFKVPQDYFDVSDENSENCFRFVSMDSNDYVSRISFNVYSKSDVGGAKELAQSDCEHNKSILNNALATVGEIAEHKYGNFDALEYRVDVNGSLNNDSVMRDVFFENGDYVYNISITVKLPNDGAEAFIDKIIDGIDAGLIDSSKVGLLLRNEYETEGTFTSKAGKWSIEIPNSFIEGSVTSDAASYADSLSGAVFSLGVYTSSKASLADVKKQFLEVEKESRANSDLTVVTPTEEIAVGGSRYAHLVIKNNDVESDGNYYIQYSTVKGKTITVFAVSVPEMSYTDHLIGKIERAISSFKN